MPATSPPVTRTKSVSISDKCEYYPPASPVLEPKCNGCDESNSSGTSKHRGSIKNSQIESNGHSSSSSSSTVPLLPKSRAKRNWTTTRQRIRSRRIASSFVNSRPQKKSEKANNLTNSPDSHSSTNKIPFEHFVKSFTPEQMTELELAKKMDGSTSSSCEATPTNSNVFGSASNAISPDASPAVNVSSRKTVPVRDTRPNFRRMETAPMDTIDSALFRRRKRATVQSETVHSSQRKSELNRTKLKDELSNGQQQQQQQQQHVMPMTFNPSWDGGFKESVISMGYRIYGVRDIDNRSETFVVDFRLFANWNDRRLAKQIQDGELSLQDGEPVDPDQIWVPQFQISQAIDHDVVDTGCTLEDSATGWVRWHQRFRATVSQYLHLARFPYDAQNLKILIRLPRRSDNRRIFTVRLNEQRSSGPNVINPFHLDEWTVHEPSASLKLVKNKPEFTISVPVRRKHGFYFTNVGLFMFALTSLAFVSLFFPVDSLDARSDTTLALILTAVAFKLVVADNLPQIPYSTWLDKYIMMCFAFLFLISVGNVVISQIDQIAAGFVEENNFSAAAMAGGDLLGPSCRSASGYSETEIARLSNTTFAVLMLVVWCGLHVHVYRKVSRWQKVLDGVMPPVVETTTSFEDNIEKMFTRDGDKRIIALPSTDRVSRLDMHDAKRSKASFMSRSNTMR